MILNKKKIERLEKIKIFLSDVDGTLTTGSTMYSKNGEALKTFSQRDGRGFFLLKENGILTGFISSDDSQISRRRAEKLTIDLSFFGIENKEELLDEITGKDFKRDEIAYIGDDTNDLGIMKECGFVFAVGDAETEVKSIADYICSKNGGEGAVREAINLLIEVKNR